MKRLLATTAIALVAMASTASAQSVLERVLSQIDNATNLASVNGTFANIAENLGGSTTVYYDSTNNVTLTEAEYAAFAARDVVENYTVVATGDAVNNTTGLVISAAAYANLSAADQAAYSVALATQYYTGLDGVAVLAGARPVLTAAARTTANGLFDAVVTAGGYGVNGSINNIIDGITDVTQQATAGTVTAIEYNMPTFDFGDMATTALGAVNTGEITLGVNSSVDNAKTSTTEALSTVMTQLGGSADTGAIVLNVASNMTGINGSINNTMEEINGSMGNLSTTALGAVNTGTIISGVNAAVNNITGGSSGQSGL